MRTPVRSLLLFIVSIAVLVGALMLVNWIPSALEEGTLREYGSVDEAKTKLKLPELYAPAFYPQCFQWPPSLIAAQTRPFTAVVMEFTQTGKPDTCLVITQTALSHPPLSEKISLARVNEQLSYSLKGREALLESGECDDGAPCSRIRWTEKGFRISVTMRSTPVDLVKIAESMVAEHKAGRP